MAFPRASSWLQTLERLLLVLFRESVASPSMIGALSVHKEFIMRSVMFAGAGLLTIAIGAAPAVAQQVRENRSPASPTSPVSKPPSHALVRSRPTWRSRKSRRWASCRSSTCAKRPNRVPTSSRRRRLARAAGLRYFHVPFNGNTPDPRAADRFLDAITAKGSEPAFIHCSGGNRAATMWLIKRIAVDHWDVERAITEATALGQTSPTLRQFAVEYAQANRR